MVQNLWTTGFFHPSPLPYRLVKIFLLYSHWCFWPFPLSIQFHTLLFVLIAVFHKNTPNTGCPELGVHITFGNRGGSYTLLVLSQALTPLLAGVLDGSLSGCQNCRAFAVAMCFPFNKPYFQRMALYFVLFHRVNLVLQFAVTAHDLSHHAV